MLEPELAQTIEEDHQANNALVTGDPAPKKRMFSRRDDVTLANPLGPPIQGLSNIEKQLDGIASIVREGELFDFERISEYATPDLAYVVEIERSRAKFGGSDELRPFSLRATTIWRREDDGWRISHRHADPITSPRSMESLFEQ